jgi:small neutral amino acid transporter SnatA (MarC family)
VTLLALGSKCAFVRVVSPVTGDAYNRSMLELARHVTLLTRHGGMHAKQRESGQVVIKRQFYQPPLLVVTTFAGRAFLAFVHIICLMAGDAGGLQFIVVGVAAVAQPTRSLCVRAQ